MDHKLVGYEGMDWSDMSLIGAILLEFSTMGGISCAADRVFRRRLGSMQSVTNYCHSHRLIFRRNCTAIARNIRAY